LAKVSFGEWLKRRRRAEGWTQKQLAQEIHCSTITIRKMESEERRPSLQNVERLVEVFNISPEKQKEFLRFSRGNAHAFSDEEAANEHWQMPTPLFPSNLPVSLTSFVGREKEKREILNLLTRNRLVTLAGVGGIGKTRLALQVGHQVLPAYASGAWFIPLESLYDPFLVPETIALVFNIRKEPDRQVIEILKNFLRSKTILLILDNCEHLLDTCAQLIGTLLSYCPNLKVLATSREPLGIMGEAVYRVPPLGLPKADDILAQYRESEAVHLFEERAQLAQTDFVLTMENVLSIAQICNRLDGIPLAIELVAVHVDMFSPAEIAAQLEERFQVISGGNRAALPRQQTIEASISWSWNLLAENERILLRRLSVFASGWTQDAAESVCSGAEIQSSLVFGLLAQLVAKSLVVISKETGHKTRYIMLETIRDYTFKKLKDSGELQTICLSHFKFFARMVEDAEKNFKGLEQAVWYDRLDGELNNIRFALTWFKREENVEERLRLASGLWRYWKNRGHGTEGRRYLQQTLEDVPVGPARKKLNYARALTSAGALAYYESDFVYSEQSRKEALEIFRTLEDNVGIADSLNGLGNIALSQAKYSSAHDFYEEGLTIRKGLGDQWGIARLLGNLGLLAYFQTHYEQALSLHLESLALFRELHDQESTANELVNLGDVYRSQGELSQANSAYEESGVISRKLKDRWGLAYALMGMADVALEQGILSTASSLYRECLTIFQTGVDYIGLPFALESVAVLERMKNNLQKATRLLGAAHELRRRTHNPLHPPHRHPYEKNLSLLQQQLDPFNFDVAWQEGKTLDVESAVAYALED
jgi:predicted ATPase/DNA-binding XRE family transcriptional regulator